MFGTIVMFTTHVAFSPGYRNCGAHAPDAVEPLMVTLTLVMFIGTLCEFVIKSVASE